MHRKKVRLSIERVDVQVSQGLEEFCDFIEFSWLASLVAWVDLTEDLDERLLHKWVTLPIFTILFLNTHSAARVSFATLENVISVAIMENMLELVPLVSGKLFLQASEEVLNWALVAARAALR